MWRCFVRDQARVPSVAGAVAPFFVTGTVFFPSDALGHTWALPGALGGGQGLPPETGMEDLKPEAPA